MQYKISVSTQNDVLNYIKNQDKLNLFVYGETGTGKHYVINIIKNFWRTLFPSDLIIELSVSDQLGVAYNYSPFLSFLCQYDSPYHPLQENIGKALLRCVPKVGTILEAIANSHKEPGNIFVNDERYIISKIENIIGMKKVMFVCDNYAQWDLSSRILLEKILIKYKTDKNYSFLIINNEKISIESFTFFHLNNLNKSEFRNAFKENCQFTPSEDQINSIFSITDGNIGVLTKVLNVVNEHGFDSIASEINLINYVSKRLMNNCAAEDYEQIVELLKKSSFIGYTSHKVLLRLFSDLNDAQFHKDLSIACSLNYLIESPKKISFVDKNIYNSFRLASNKDRALHYKLADCIKSIFPSDYEYRALEYNAAFAKDKSIIYTILSLISHIRKFRVSIPASMINWDELDAYDLKNYYLKIAAAYGCYFQNNFVDAQNILNEINSVTNIYLRFEVDYLSSLILCNFTNDSSFYGQALQLTEKWLNSDAIIQEPEMWLRTAMLCLDFYYELKMPQHIKLLNKIMEKFDLFLETDFQIKDMYYLLYAQSSLYCKIEISIYNVQKSYKYFKDKMQSFVGFSDYFVAITNYSAQALILGMYEIPQELVTELLEIMALDSSVIPNNSTPVYNNYALSLVLSNRYEKNSIAEALNILIKCKESETDEVAIMLLNINIANLFFLT